MSADNSAVRVENFKKWYIENQQKYEQVGEYVLRRINTYLNEIDFNVAYCSSRAKTIDSAYKKAKKQIKINDSYQLKYTDPKNEIMDFSGVRLVVYLPAEMYIVSNAIERLFSNSIRYDDSENKLDRLGLDKVGYLSIHYVVEIATTEPEYMHLNRLKCEIQVRTVLQDAWAQIFHDRVYKGADIGDDSSIQRKVNLLAGNLELIDNQINEIVSYYDKKTGNLGAKSYQALLDEQISEKALIKYCNLLLQGKVEKFYSYEQIRTLLNSFGINTIRQLDNHVNSGFIQELVSTGISLTIDRLVRYILVVSDYHKFFECTDKSYTFVIDQAIFDLLDKFVNMADVCKQYNIKKSEDNI